MPIRIFEIPQVVNLIFPESTTGEGPILMNYPANRTDFRLILGVTNNVEFFVRDIDRKATTVAGRSFTIRITDPASNRLLLTQGLTVTIAEQALLRLTIGPDEMEDWPLGALRWSVTCDLGEGNEVMLWSDQDYTHYSELLLVEGPFPGPIDPIVSEGANLLHRDGFIWTGASPGPVTVGRPGSVASFQITLTNFTGSITVQASLESQPDSGDENWFDVDTYDYHDAFTGDDGFTFSTNHNWFRLKFTSTQGNIVRVLFRN